MNLYWALGFGWISLATLVALACLTILTTAWLRGVFGSLTALWLSFLAYQCYRWNGSAWRRMHHRAMLMYAAIAGSESGRASREGRPFDFKRACTVLAEDLSGKKNSAAIENLIEYLNLSTGPYFQQVLKDESARLFGNDVARRDKFLRAAAQAEFGPRAVIAHIVQNTYGTPEAARYIVAVLNGEAN